MTARGEIWLVDFGAPTGREAGGVRPAMVVSSDQMNGGPAQLAIVVPLTTTRRRLLNHVEVEPGPSGLDEVSYATCEDVRPVSERRLVHRLGRVESPVVHTVDTILRHLLEL